MITNRCWNNPTLDQLAQWLETPTVPVHERLDGALAHVKHVRGQHDLMVQISYATARALSAYPEEVRSWVTTSNPADSISDGVGGQLPTVPTMGGAETFAATTPVKTAGTSRKSGQLSTDADQLALAACVLTESGWNAKQLIIDQKMRRDDERFDRCLQQFYEYFDTADHWSFESLYLEPQHPVAAVVRLDAGRGHLLPEADWWQRYDVAHAVSPTLYRAHTTMVRIMSPSLCGSTEIMFDFTRKIASEAPVGDPIGAVLALAHYEYERLNPGDEQVLAMRQRDDSLITYAADRWLNGGAGQVGSTSGGLGQAHPYAVEAHQLFGWYFAGTARGNYHMGATGGRVAFLPWDLAESPSAAWSKAFGVPDPATTPAVGAGAK